MKKISDFLLMDHKHMQHDLCHPRREPAFDNQSIQRKIDQIRQKKQQLRVQAQQKHLQLLAKQQRYQQFPLQRILQQSLQPLDQLTSMRIKQKVKFIQQKVYIGTKNNTNSQYISKVVDENEAKPAVKYQLSLFMQDMLSNVESDIVSGAYDIFNRKDIILHKYQHLNENHAAKLIQIKKNELTNKIEQLKGQLDKTQSQNYSQLYSVRGASSEMAEAMIENHFNLEDFSIKSERTKQAERFVKNLQKQQQQQRKQRKKRQQQLRKLEVRSQQQKKQFQQHMRKQRHQKLKKRFQQQRKQKAAQIQTATNAKAQFQKFLSQYRKRIPLYKQKQLKFNRQKQQQDKQKMMQIQTEIKQSKRSIDLKQLRQHQSKYKIMKEDFQKQKMESLKHRQKQIYLRHKHDKLYFRGRYHSMIKDEIQKQPEDPFAKRDELLKKQKEYGQKVKKQFVPEADQNKQKQLEELILKINRNKPNGQKKNINQVGNKYLADLHKLIKQMRAQGKVKVQLPEQLKPRYRNYLDELKKSRNYRTLSYDSMSPDDLEKQALRSQQNAKRKQRVLALTDQIDIEKQLKQIDQMDMQLLKSAQLKAKLFSRYRSIDNHHSGNLLNGQ